MSEMASCQRIFEQKAIDAEEKLRKWRKKNPLKGDGKSGYDGQGKKKSGGSGADSDSYSDEEQSVKVWKYFLVHLVEHDKNVAGFLRYAIFNLQGD